MAMVNKAGTYFGAPLAWSVGKSATGIPEFKVQFAITDYWDGKAWADVAAQRQEITGYFYPLKKDRVRNDATIEMLKARFAWDGLSFANLHAGNYIELRMQIEIKEETYEGKRQLKIGRLYAPDYAGEVLVKADASVAENLDKDFGAVLAASAPAAAAAGTPGRVAPPKR